jgi:4-hydroxy-4-methyl-2-oxoglutarate aldolase
VTTTALPTDDQERLALVRDQLYTAVVGDYLDVLGRTHQFLPPQIHGIATDMRLVGRAMPVLISDVFGPQPKPFGLLTEAMDQLEPGEVYVARNGDLPVAAWGELLTATARHRGAVGAVIDGYHRDTPQILAQDWPVFSRGGYAQDAGVRKIVADFRCTVEIGQVTVHPGDLIFGDRDGVVVVPQDVEDEVLERALAKSQGENEVRKAIEGGMSSTEAFRRFGIL